MVQQHVRSRVSEAAQRWREKAKAYRVLAASSRVKREQQEFTELAATYDRLADELAQGLNPRLPPERIVRQYKP